MSDLPGYSRGRGRIRTRSPSGARGAARSPDRATATSSSSPKHGSVKEVSSGIGSVHISPASDAGISYPRGASRGGARQPTRLADELVKTRPEDLKTKQGKKGTLIDMATNYFRLKTQPTWRLFQYDVKFLPEEDSVRLKKLVIYTMMQDHDIGWMFDGAQLFTSKHFSPEEAKEHTFKVQLQPNKKGETRPPYTMKVTKTGTLNPGNPVYIQLYNLLIRKCLFALDLVQMGRHFFDPNAVVDLPAQRLQLWPGFITSMRAHEKDILLCVEATHKVVRMESVLEVINGIKRNCRGGEAEFINSVRSEFIHTVVMTPYNNKTYHIDDISFSTNPRTTFQRKGEDISFVEYYKSKGLEVTDLNQPLLVSNPKDRDLRRDPSLKPTVLIPELCRSTGLTDAMRANFSLMKELGKHLHQGPEERVKVINGFMRRILSHPELQKEFTNWDVHFEKDLATFQGRVLPTESVIFANGKDHRVDDKGDFTMAFRSQKMLSAVNLTDWAIVVPQRDSAGVDNLIRTMTKVATPLDMRISNPKKVVQLPDTRVQTYRRILSDIIQELGNLQMLFVILPNNKLETYAAVKKLLAVEQGIPSQCFVAKNVQSKGLMSIATKVVVQMNAKLGGEPWTVKLPLKDTMFVGFDVYHGAKGTKGGNIGAMVASFSPTFSRYFSTTSAYTNDDELAQTVRKDLEKCLNAYREVNKGLPQKIFLYRDGVGDGQVQQVFTVELVEIRSGLKNMYEKYGLAEPTLTFIIVTKKINSRLFHRRPNGTLANPGPGTVGDDLITLADRYDFFLISCAARQGTVSPCSYNVIYDSSGFDPDRIQLMTYKLCHMYYNWSGTIAVPAPCQYAHKLAFLTGMAYAGHAHEKLGKLLHFL